MKIKVLTKAAAALLAAMMVFPAAAVEVKGQVSYPYEGKVFSNKPSDDDKAEALRQAKLSAISRYTSGFSISEQKLYAGIRSNVEANPDKYIAGSRVVAEEVDTSLRTINLVLRVDVNDSLILSEMHAAAGSLDAVPTGDGSLFASLFVAREVYESRIFDEKKTSIEQRKKSVDQSMSGSLESMEDTNQTTTGGSVVRKSAANKYREIAATDFNAAFSQVLTQLGYEPAEYADVYENCGGADPEILKNAFMKSDELPSKLRNQAIRAAKSCDVKYFASGYMNVSAPQKDSVSGQIKVVVSVNGMVWDISKKLPRKVGSVGPVQAYGLAPDQDTARREALRQAASAAGQAIGAQLGSKNIR